MDVDDQPIHTASSAPAATAFTATECRLLDHLVPDRENDHVRTKSLCSYLIKVARLGGYLARGSDPPPGNIVIWRGLSRLIDIQLGFQVAQVVGN